MCGDVGREMTLHDKELGKDLEKSNMRRYEDKEEHQVIPKINIY
jgi:hypothetical protein